MYFLSFEFLEEDFDYILFLKFDFAHAFEPVNIKDLTTALALIYQEDPDIFVILTHWKEQPMDRESPDEFIYSFSCSFNPFKEAIHSYSNGAIDSQYLLFELLDHILKGNSAIKKILVRQIPMVHPAVANLNTYDVIIPHRGSDAYLGSLLFFMSQLERTHLFVGLDQEVTEEIMKFKNDYPKASFFSFQPHPVGPYVVRNRLIEESNHQFLFFQDSDDIPCADRFASLTDYMIRNECQLCGSNEIKLDYFEKTVRAIRYPKNVNASLLEGPVHSLLHPTSAITREAFYACGKLSEERIFGNDTKFLYRSFFTLNTIQNINEFLYIRRIHPGSLSTSPATKIGSPVRHNLLYRWGTDFELVKSGQLKLEDSSLVYEGSRMNYTMKKL